MSWLQRARAALRRKLTEMDWAEQDEAHLATRGDRPFPGCRPDAPNEEPPEARDNRVAQPRRPKS
ncbi:MAG: hypothetical protein QNJ67_01965 [Kiloniellales bacterium]|nr:hypothetical protein [Kiloniellales bacterium]